MQIVGYSNEQDAGFFPQVQIRASPVISFHFSLNVLLNE